jgi:hypothetical protein
MVEKIRRTVKIWAERHVFSVRYVNDLIKGLDPYRNGNNTVPPGGGGGGGPSSTPILSPSSPGDNKISSPIANLNESASDKDDNQQEEQEQDSVSMGGRSDNDDDDDDDIDDLFGNASNKLLKIDVDLDQAAAASSSSAAAGSKKRRRSNDFNNGSGKSATAYKSRRRSILSTNSLMDLWNQVSNLQMNYDRVQGTLKEINRPEYLDEEAANEQIDTLVGDELLQEYKKTIQYESKVDRQRKELYDIAQNRKALELEAMRYLPWLEIALKQDEDDIKFCDKYAEQLRLFEHVHKPARDARDKRLREEDKRRKVQEELQKKKEEDEERRRFMESAMSKQTEAQPGMVWNKATGEYQTLNTDESWRD